MQHGFRCRMSNIYFKFTINKQIYMYYPVFITVGAKIAAFFSREGIWWAEGAWHRPNINCWYVNEGSWLLLNHKNCFWCLKCQAFHACCTCYSETWVKYLFSFALSCAETTVHWLCLTACKVNLLHVYAHLWSFKASTFWSETTKTASHTK